MPQTIGTIIFLVLALVVIVAVLNLVLGALGIVFALIPLLIKLAVFAGVIYLGWMLFRKLVHTREG